MYGIKSVIPKTLNMPIKKPLRLATNSQIIGTAFSTKCGGHQHTATCEGKDTTQTEGYSETFANVFHKAWKRQCLALFEPKGASGAETDPEKVVSDDRGGVSDPVLA